MIKKDFVELDDNARITFTNFINKHFEIGENDRDDISLYYDCRTKEIETTGTVKLKKPIDSNAMRILMFRCSPFKETAQFSMDVSIDHFILRGKLTFVSRMLGQSEEYDIERLRIQCSHVNVLPFTKGDMNANQKITNLLEELMNHIPDSIKLIDGYVYLTLYTKNSDLICSYSVNGEEISKTVMSHEAYKTFMKLTEELHVDPGLRLNLNIVEGDDLKRQPVGVSTTRVHEDGSVVDLDDEIIIVNMNNIY